MIKLGSPGSRKDLQATRQVTCPGFRNTNRSWSQPEKVIMQGSSKNNVQAWIDDLIGRVGFCGFRADERCARLFGYRCGGDLSLVWGTWRWETSEKSSFERFGMTE
jgi:hypothetical protein